MEYVKLILSLIGIIGLILMLFYAIKRLNRSVAVGGGGRMRVIDRVNLGRDSSLLVVSVHDRLILVGVSAQRVEKLGELDCTEAEYLSASSEGGTAAQKKFADILGSVIRGGKKNGEDGATSDDEDKSKQQSDKQGGSEENISH